MSLLEVRVGDTRVVFTDRHGGVSEPPYDSANLGFLTGDDPEHVRENRRRVGRALGGVFEDPERWFRIRQVHGPEVAVAGRQSARDAAPEADSAVTAAADRPLLVLTADCAPVALVTPGAVGAVHAGWRGLRDGVVEAAVGEVRKRAPARAAPAVRAVIGPCIRAERYAFGADDLDALATQLGPELRATTADGSPALDLRAGVRAALERAGVSDITDVDVCTAASPDHFSYRRDGVTGRQGMLVARTSVAPT
jgi:YfiH family protein